MASENESGIRSFAAGEALEANRRVKLSSGTVVYADAADVSIGITVDAQATTGGQVGVKLHNFPGTRKVTCSEAVTSGAVLYGTADGKVGDTYSNLSEKLGIALEAGDGDDSKIEMVQEAGGTEILANSVVQSDAGGTSDAAEFTFSNGSVTIPAGEVRVGDLFEIHAQGNLPATNGADTFKFRLYVGTEKICESAAPDAVNGDIFGADALVTVRVAGSGGKLKAMGRTYNDAAAAGLDVPFSLAEASEALDGAITITARGLFSASSAGNEARLEQFVVKRIRK
jgi:hypothetical protein